jgi:hypothetical protein
MMNNDKDHPWFRPLWRRVLVVAICFAVALWDLSNGEFVWALIFGGLGGYAVYIFFIAWNRDAPAGETPKKPDD